MHGMKHYPLSIEFDNSISLTMPAAMKYICITFIISSVSLQLSSCMHVYMHWQLEAYPTSAIHVSNCNFRMTHVLSWHSVRNQDLIHRRTLQVHVQVIVGVSVVYM